MNIKQIRHATIIIKVGEYKIMVDPMLMKKNSMTSILAKSLLKKTNPMVDLPKNSMKDFDTITHILITHDHFDHFDKEAKEYFKKKQTPTLCSPYDYDKFKKLGLNTIKLEFNKENKILNGTINLIDCKHGTGISGKLMGNGVGYMINIPNEPSIYVVGDTILTDNVKNAIKSHNPNYMILAGGEAKLLGFESCTILMDEKEIIETINLSNGKVILNHLDSFDHCLLKRDRLKEIIKENNFEKKVFIPNDGEEIECK